MPGYMDPEDAFDIMVGLFTVQLAAPASLNKTVTVGVPTRVAIPADVDFTVPVTLQALATPPPEAIATIFAVKTAELLFGMNQ
jgi:hypothetical protein